MKSKIISSLFLIASLTTNAQAQNWTGQGEAGIVSASGNTDSETINVGLKFKKSTENWSHAINLSAFKTSSDNQDTANNISAGYTLKRNLTDRSNIFLDIGFLDDDFDGFTEHLSTSLGYGYKVINNDKTQWETGIGAGYRDTSELTILDDGSELEGDDLSSVTFVLRSDYTNQLTSTTKFVDAFKAEFGAENTYIENDASLYVSMSERFSLKVGFIVRHNTDPAAGSDETDTISSLSLVYSFGNK